MISNIATMLNTFWSSFSIPAYVEDHVPNDAPQNYITYTLSIPDRGDRVSMQARVWYTNSNSFVNLNKKVEEIESAIGTGYSMSDSSNMIVIFKDTNFYQNQPFPDNSNVRVAYLNTILMVN